MEFLVLVVVFYGIYRIIKEFLDFFLKKKLINNGNIEKIKLIDESISFSENTENKKYSSLKWGLVFLFAGLGIFVGAYLNLVKFLVASYQLKQMLLAGTFLIFSSLGFLIYFIIIMKLKK